MGPDRRAFFDPRFIRMERRRAYRMAYMLFWSILLYLVFSQLIVGVGIITDRSMFPTLRDGDHFLVNKYLYRIAHPRRGDIVVLRPRDEAEDQYVKRVVGLPGDTLHITGGFVYVNNQRLEEPYAVGRTWPDRHPLLIPPETYYVLGDNRGQSEDSRRFGPVPRRHLTGKIQPGEWFPFW